MLQTMTARPRRAAMTAALTGVAACALLAAAFPAQAQNRLVNMVPQARSGETNQDAEGTLAIDPADYRRMVGSAFTWDNLTGSAMTTATAPIYVSNDAGATWTLNFTLPSAVGSTFPTGDINPSFGSNLSGAPTHETSWLYTGILRSHGGGVYSMTVLRAPDYLDGALMTTLDDVAVGVDQPHTATLGDKVFVGFNNKTALSVMGGVCSPRVANGRTATLDVTQNGAVAAPTFGLDLIESRDTNCQDGFAEVPFANLDGTIYAAFFHSWWASPRVVVVRDDTAGASATPFTALNDSGDSQPGQYVTAALTLPYSGSQGQNRLGASNMSIAVDPRDTGHVYVAYGDSGGAGSGTIHVVHSTTHGQTWSGDIMTVTNASNPELAINALGTVGLLYQRVVAGRWDTRLVRSTTPGGTTFDAGVVLANTSASAPTSTFSPYIGDYASLRTAGKNFYGVFSASNYPDTANFLPGVSFPRYHDFATHTLYADAAHTTVVPISIDPFFFEVDAITPDLNFYVRDWTDDLTHGDTGVEPSTHPVFYATSDVWNQRSSTAAPFVNDQPPNEDAGNGAGNIGDNWAYARVRRNVGGAATPVTAHFLVSKFGTGSAYVDASSGDPDVSFPDPDPVIATGAGTGPWISAAYHWHLNAIAGDHLCLAVEISAAGSPYIPPSLVNETPGWPTTDLRIVNDNHKAQRNMHLSTTPATGGPSAGGSVTDYAIAHNAATFTRDMTLRIGVSGVSKRYVRGASVSAVGTDTRQERAGLGQTLVLRGMRPGENRWLALSIDTLGVPAGAQAYITVDDVVGGVPVNGFGVGVRPAPMAVAVKQSLDGWRRAAGRLDAGFGAGASAGDVEASRGVDASGYAAFVKAKLVPHLRDDLAKAGALAGSDSYGLDAMLKAISAEPSAPVVVSRVASLLNAVDARLTELQLRRGDVADISQMVRWQRDLFRRDPRLSKAPCAAKVAAASDAFLKARQGGKVGNAEAYPKLLSDVRACLVEAAGGKALGDLGGTNLADLERQHRAYLLALSKS